MREALVKGKQQISSSLLEFAAQVEESVYRAMEALKDNDFKLSESILETEKLINKNALKIEDDCISLMALQGPVAGDLRELVSILKVLRELERIGDHSAHIAKSIIKNEGFDNPELTGIVERMGRHAADMLNKSVSAFCRKDADLARQVGAMDKTVDSLHAELVGKAVADMFKGTEEAVRTTNYLFISRFAERIGDHVRNICEDVLYIVEGKHEEL